MDTNEHLDSSEKSDELQKEKYLEKLKQFRLFDDTYARTYFRTHPELAEFVLRIITGIKDLTIDPSEYETQYDAKRLAGSRSLIMDVHAGDTHGKKYNLEVENRTASPERAEYHVAAMCVEHLKPGADFSDLPEIYIIFLCDTDSVGNGEAITPFSFRADNAPHASMNGRTHVIYVNGDYKDDGSDIAKLIHDFKCRNADDMYFENLAERTRYLKTDPKGVSEMCRIMDEMKKETVIEIALNLLKIGKNSYEEIANATGLTLDEVKKLAEQLAA